MPPEFRHVADAAQTGTDVPTEKQWNALEIMKAQAGGSARSGAPESPQNSILIGKIPGYDDSHANGSRALLAEPDRQLQEDTRNVRQARQEAESLGREYPEGQAVAIPREEGRAVRQQAVYHEALRRGFTMDEARETADLPPVGDMSSTPGGRASFEQNERQRAWMLQYLADGANPLEASSRADIKVGRFRLKDDRNPA